MDNAIVYSSSEAGWPEGFSSPPSILLVDDEAKILTSMRRLLHPLGYHIIIAESGEKALEILSQETVDLVISDMRMPNMDGAQFLSQVRQHWPYSLRILLTGYADIASTVMAINKAEIYRYIAKPWDDDEMILT
ncbi:MAG: response regulator, partial [Pseudomonadota bacterium]